MSIFVQLYTFKCVHFTVYYLHLYKSVKKSCALTNNSVAILFPFCGKEYKNKETVKAQE